MSLNNLRNYNWEQGTLSNPVSLTGTQFSWLINLLKKGTVSKDIRGYIQVGSPITSYEKYLVELAKDENNQPLLHLVNPTVTPVEYTVVPQASTIKEGTSTKLNINGIGLDALKFRIVNHTNTTPDYQERTTIDTELGYVRVAPAKENTTWTDVVTIQTCPVWEEWTDQGASIVEFDVTVNAVAVTSVTITAPQYVKPGVTFNPIVNFLPVGHTKPIVNTLEDAAAKKGICFIPTSDDFSVGKTTDPTKMSAIAPNTETPVGDTWSLGCGVYAFTNAQTMATPSVNVTVKYPYIQFIVTTDGTFSDISTANPKITLQKVDSEDEPIGQPIVLTGTVNSSSLVYTYGNGNIAGDGSETYHVSIESVHGYTTPNIANIVPNGVITSVSASYTAIQPGIFVIYSDGTEEQAEDTISRYSFLSGKTPVFIKILSADGAFAIPFSNVTEETNLMEPRSADTSSILSVEGDYGSTIGRYMKELDEVSDNRNGNNIVKRTPIYLNINSGKEGIENDPVNIVYNKIISFNNIEHHGYLPISYHLRMIKMNRSYIQQLLSLGNSTNVYPTFEGNTLSSTNGRYVVFSQNHGNMLIAVAIPNKLSLYNNNMVEISNSRYDWSAPNKCIKEDQTYKFTISPIYFI